LAKSGVFRNPVVKDVNPGQFDIKLEYRQHVDANPPLSTFTWTYNGVVTTETSNELPLIPQADGVIETASRKAKNYTDTERSNYRRKETVTMHYSMQCGYYEFVCE